MCTAVHVHCCACAVLYMCTAVTYICTAVLVHSYTCALLYMCTTLQVHYYTCTLLYMWIDVHVHRCTCVLLHMCTSVFLNICTCELMILCDAVHVHRLGINNFFVNSENLGIRIWQKKSVNYDKFEITQDWVNQIINPNAFFSSFWQGLHDITMTFTYYSHILHHLQAMKMIFLKLFLICTFKDENLAEK